MNISSESNCSPSTNAESSELYNPDNFDPLFNDPDNFDFILPNLPQKLTNQNYKDLLEWHYDKKTFPIEPLTFQVRNQLCSVCQVYQKPSSLSYGKCKRPGKGKSVCEPIYLQEIPIEIRLLTSKEKNSLRLLKIYVENQLRNSYSYERFKGTAKLSLNWEVWLSCSGLVGINNEYLRSLRWLIKHNYLYKDIVFPKATLDCFWENENIYGVSSGEVFQKFTTRRTIDQTHYGTDDANRNVLPVGDIVKNGVKTVIGLTFQQKDAYLFPHLYPDGKGAIENNRTARAMDIRTRLFHKDPRFRKSAMWMFYHFDEMEKFRLVDNNARQLKNNSNNFTRDELICSSKYSFKSIFDDNLTTTVPISCRGLRCSF